jgi:IS5 family transposase
MSIIPDFVRSYLATYLTALVYWFSDQVYADLIRRDADHLLVHLHDHLDIAPLETACAAFHHATGPGTRPAHPVPQLVRAFLVKYLFDWSLREVEWQVRYNLMVKWFVGYPIFAVGPDHSTLERFEQWVCTHHHRTIFDEVLHQIDAALPAERQQAQIGDTFALQADAARESLVRLIRHTGQRLLTVLDAASSARGAQVRAQINPVALFGPPHEIGEYRLSRAERATRLQTTVLAALDCAQRVRAVVDQAPPLEAEARAPVGLWLDLLDKVIQDDIELTRDAHGAVIGATERKDKGSYRLGSATDPEATYRVHDDQVALGYNVSLAVSDNFIREIHADTGAQPDNVGVPALITAQQEHQDLTPAKLIYDAAAGTGKTLAQVRAVSDGHTHLVAPLLPFDKRTDRFTPDRFQLSDDGVTLTCPNGQTSSIAYRSGSGEGRTFRFFAPQCRGCPLWELCRQDPSGSKAMRQVFVSDYRAEVDAARAYSLTPEFQADRQRRSRVERFIAELVRYNGARRARRRGRFNADFQAKMNATALNLKRWMRLLHRRRPQPAMA